LGVTLRYSAAPDNVDRAGVLQVMFDPFRGESPVIVPQSVTDEILLRLMKTNGPRDVSNPPPIPTSHSS
jgi:hypothetical protein